MAYANELVGYSNSTWLLAGLRACMAKVLLGSWREEPYCTMPRWSFLRCGRVNEISRASSIVLLGPLGADDGCSVLVPGSSSRRFLVGGPVPLCAEAGSCPFVFVGIEGDDRM